MLPSRRDYRPKAPFHLTPPQRRLAIAGTLIIGLGALFPWALAQAMRAHGVDDHHYHARRTTGVVAVVCGLILLFGYARDRRRDKRRTTASQSQRAIKSQTFQCVAPQTPGEFVVFPVRVARRGVAASRVVSLDGEELRVELDTKQRDAAGRLDTEASLRSLLEAALLPRFPTGAAEVVTFYGEGPTGLAGGLALRRGAPDFALGRKVGMRFILILGYASAGVVTIMIAMVQDWPMLVLVLIILSACAAAIVDGAGNVPFLRAVHPYERAEMTSVFVTYRHTAQLVTPGVFSLVLGVFALPAVFVVGGAGFVSMAWLARYLPKRL